MPINQINNLQNSSFNDNAAGISNNNSLIEKQYNFFTSLADENNKITIELDTEKFKKEYQRDDCFHMDNDGLIWADLDDVYYFESKKYIGNLLSKLLDLKIDFLENKNISFNIVTKDYNELAQKIKMTNDINLKLKLNQEFENHKTRYKEINLLFKLVFNDIINIYNKEDARLFIDCLNILLTSNYIDVNKMIVRQKYIDILREYICAFENYLDIFTELEKSDIFENLFIPSRILLSNKTKKGFKIILVIHSVRKKIGILINKDFNNLLEDRYFKSKLYTEVIRRLVYHNLNDKINYDDYFSGLNSSQYTATLNFEETEMELRRILKRKNFNSQILQQYNILFENPI